MWIKGIMLAALGLSAGAAAAGGIFSFIIGLGVVSDLADRTHTGEQIRLYEDAVALGGILGTIWIIFQIPIPKETGCCRHLESSEESLWDAGPWPWQKS